MKKPTPPTKPKVPQEPKQVYFDSISYSIGLDGLTLQDALNQIAEAGNENEKFPNLIRRALGPVEFKNARFEYDGDYDDASLILKWEQPVEITLTDAEFARVSAKYQADLAKYQIKQAQYLRKQTEYAEKLKAYLAEQRANTEARELKLLKTLERKYSK